MKFSLKVLAILISVLLLFLFGLFAYSWFTYIDETVTEGHAYSFTIGSSKLDTVEDFEKLLKKYPEMHVYVSYGQRAGDYFSIPARSDLINKLSGHHEWELLLDGQNEYSNSINLYFVNDRLVKVYRHRQNFELP